MGVFTTGLPLLVFSGHPLTSVFSVYNQAIIQQINRATFYQLMNDGCLDLDNGAGHVWTSQLAASSL